MAANEIAKREKPFLEGEFVKDCMLKVVEIVCPDTSSIPKCKFMTNDTNA